MNKFSKFTQTLKEQEKTQTHADLQTDLANQDSRSTTITISLTNLQKKQLETYANADDRSKAYVIKQALIEKGIISK